ncbi:pectate lyase superfamily protein-domain-containing protein [Plectosphaerella cucumerina]|uniref:Pectate lyase superfamily protein-domain-containing protein n=1 Tax=Plectosphaerella cucumerina TaxID=40658 RepID=A0A8K0TIY1_9PEZI|nr:pectate lyase superfamily protein-domain-containing protein [Plectosphaerella cucumerina]
MSYLRRSGYQFFRNIKDFGAVGDGVTDDTGAINRAAAAFSQSSLDDVRCDGDCGSTTTLTAVVYFPPGTYLISSPIMQYYYTEFVSNPEARAIIKGSSDFSGIALFDANFYIPGGAGKQWYVNQSNFFRQIRHFVFDMTGMPKANYQNDQKYVTTGIHWQVGQATSITNCHFEMPLSDAEGSTTAIGTFMENGSGGAVSDLSFFGGNIGFLAGSQQFTAQNLRFTLSLAAIKHEWNWGFVWKNIYVQSCYVAIDCTAFSDSTKPPQGTGSITVLDSHFNGVPYAITVSRHGNQQPNLVLDNLLVENSESVVLVSGGETLLAGSAGPLTINGWASGYQVLPGGFAGKTSGYINPLPNKPAGLLDGSGKHLYRPKPQYPGMMPIVATANGVSNDGTGDQAAAINRLLASSGGSVVFFPAGVYKVRQTVQVPVGTRMIGSGWSTIMGEGAFFQNEADPKPLIRVGNPGDSGVWNVHESSQGSAAMWDTHVRIGGNAGSDLLLKDCPAKASGINEKCKAAFMLMHVTKQASGYFDNVWLWVADHDLDDPANALTTVTKEGIPLNGVVEISVYAGRGVLIESDKPSWWWGCGSEHTQLYQWQLMGAKNLYMGHMQTETPYYQPNPNALEPFKIGNFAGDPTFEDCSDGICTKAWALRILNSTDIFLYGLGFYSFFDDNGLGCAPLEKCQQSLIQTNYAGRVFLHNIFTRGTVEIVSPNGLLPVFSNDTTRNGYTSNVAAWFPLALGGEDIGNGLNPGEDGSGVVYIDALIYDSEQDANVECFPPCTYVLPPFVLDWPTTISFPPWTKTLEVGWMETVTVTRGVSEVIVTRYTSVTEVTVITIPPVTTDRIEVRNIVIDEGVTNTTFFAKSSIPIPPLVIVHTPNVDVDVTIPPRTRTVSPPPWPWPEDEVSSAPGTTTAPPPTGTDTGGEDDDEDDDDDDDDDNSNSVVFWPFWHKTGPPRPRCRGICGVLCKFFCIRPCLLFCPAADRNFDHRDPIDPLSPPPPGPTGTCTTRTFSSCRDYCTALPVPTCTESCSRVVGCDATGTRIPSTVTPAPIGTDGISDPDHTTADGQGLASNFLAAMSHLSAEGLFGIGPLPPTVTDGPQLPTLSPPSSCNMYTTTTVCNGSGGRPVCITSSVCATLPPLTGIGGPYSGPGCATYTPTVICNGSGGGQACITDNICVASQPPCPTWKTIGTPLCPTDRPLCIRPSSITRCGWVAEQTEAPAVAAEKREVLRPSQLTAESQPQATLVPQASRSPSPESILDMAPEAMVAGALDAADDDVTLNNNTGVIPRSLLLGERQAVPNGCGGDETGGCTVIRFCPNTLCATVSVVSCVQAFVTITMHPINTEVTLSIVEDGELTCTWSIKCLTISTPGCLEDLTLGERDCGGGNKIEGWGNTMSTVAYISAKTNGRRYMLYLGQDGGNQYYPCPVTIRFWALCVDSGWSASEGLCRPAALLRDVSPRRLELGE